MTTTKKQSMSTPTRKMKVSSDSTNKATKTTTPAQAQAPPIPATSQLNESFEDALKEPAVDEGPKKENRGGVRPGAGRPRGVTDDFAAVNQLPEKANLLLVPVLQMPFDAWSLKAGIPELALSKDEAKELALPVTQLLQYYFPGKIPEIAWAWLLFASSAMGVLRPRFEILAKKSPVVTPGGAAASAQGQQQPAGDVVNPNPKYPKAKE